MRMSFKMFDSVPEKYWMFWTLWLLCFLHALPAPKTLYFTLNVESHIYTFQGRVPWSVSVDKQLKHVRKKHLVSVLTNGWNT